MARRFSPATIPGHGARFALQPVDPFGLLAAFVDGQHETAIHQLLVDVDRGGCQHDRNRSFDVIFLGLHPPGRRVLSRARDSQLPFRLEELQSIAGLLRAFFLDDGEDLVLQILFAQVIERLPGHGAVFDLFLAREEAQYRFH